MKLKTKNIQTNEYIEEDEFYSKKVDSFGKLLLKRFMKHKLAVAGAIVMILLIFVTIFAELICPYPANASHLDALSNGRPLAPNAQFIWGTDALGRDYFTRCIYGGRVSLTVGFFAVFLQMIIGVPLGCLCGYYGGKLDIIMNRLIEILSSIPTMFIIMAINSTLQPSIWNVVWVIGIFGWSGFTRMVRGYFLSLKRQDFVQAAHALGLKERTIIFKHILPNAMMPVVITAATSVIGAIMMETGLSYLGMGVQEPTPSWGTMLNVSAQFIRRVPTMALFPGLLITAITLSLNFIGDGLRDALDPHTTD